MVEIRILLLNPHQWFLAKQSRVKINLWCQKNVKTNWHLIGWWKHPIYNQHFFEKKKNTEKKTMLTKQYARIEELDYIAI